MNEQLIVSKEEWLVARLELMKLEKEFTQMRDQLSRQRRELPWVEVSSNYVFQTPEGEAALSELFNGKSQLAIYHFMFGPDWEEGCPSCSFWADSYNGNSEHLQQRDISLLAISRAPIEKLSAYKKRMGWDFNWYSSLQNDFNFDYAVSFTQQQIDSDDLNYNFNSTKFSGEEAPGFSVFYKNEQGKIYHCYSTYARGLDMLNACYQIMDLTPKGRNEDELPYSMAWLKRHDQY